MGDALFRVEPEGWPRASGPQSDEELRLLYEEFGTWWPIACDSLARVESADAQE